MKKAFLTVMLLAIAMCVTFTVRGADLIVEENGVLPNFSSIQAAVTAAQPGDRIFVKNKSGGIPYQENVTIDKPLELLAFDSNGQFLVFGSYTLSANGANFTANDQHITIIGMLNQSGSINATSNNSTGFELHLNMMSNQLNSGSINLSGTGYVSQVAGNWLLSGHITTREATISGNLVNGNITINDGAGFFPSRPDTLYVVGNRITTNTGAVVSGYIRWQDDDHYFHIANNWVRSNYTAGLIYIGAVRTGTGTNMISNNSMETATSARNYGTAVYPNLPVGCRLKIENNVIHDGHTGNDSNSEYACYFASVTSGSLVEVNYNVHEGFEFGFTNGNGTIISFVSNQQAPTTLDADNVTGVCSTAECINAGHPSTDYTDHDLSRNDRGVFGGSYNYNNFWPILTGGARVYLVKTPRTVVQSSTINAEADAHDR